MNNNSKDDQTNTTNDQNNNQSLQNLLNLFNFNNINNSNNNTDNNQNQENTNDNHSNNNNQALNSLLNVFNNLMGSIGDVLKNVNEPHQDQKVNKRLSETKDNYLELIKCLTEYREKGYLYGMFETIEMMYDRRDEIDYRQLGHVIGGGGHTKEIFEALYYLHFGELVSKRKIMCMAKLVDVYGLVSLKSSIYSIVTHHQGGGHVGDLHIQKLPNMKEHPLLAAAVALNNHNPRDDINIAIPLIQSVIDDPNHRLYEIVDRNFIIYLLFLLNSHLAYSEIVEENILKPGQKASGVWTSMKLLEVISKALEIGNQLLKDETVEDYIHQLVQARFMMLFNILMFPHEHGPSKLDLLISNPKGGMVGEKKNKKVNRDGKSIVTQYLGPSYPPIIIYRLGLIAKELNDDSTALQLFSIIINQHRDIKGLYKNVDEIVISIFGLNSTNLEMMVINSFEYVIMIQSERGNLKGRADTLELMMMYIESSCTILHRYLHLALCYHMVGDQECYEEYLDRYVNDLEGLDTANTNNSGIVMIISDIMNSSIALPEEFTTRLLSSIRYNHLARNDVDYYHLVSIQQLIIHGWFGNMTSARAIYQDLLTRSSGTRDMQLMQHVVEMLNGHRQEFILQSDYILSILVPIARHFTQMWVNLENRLVAIKLFDQMLLVPQFSQLPIFRHMTNQVFDHYWKQYDLQACRPYLKTRQQTIIKELGYRLRTEDHNLIKLINNEITMADFLEYAEIDNGDYLEGLRSFDLRRSLNMCAVLSRKYPSHFNDYNSLVSMDDSTFSGQIDELMNAYNTIFLIYMHGFVYIIRPNDNLTVKVLKYNHDDIIQYRHQFPFIPPPQQKDSTLSLKKINNLFKPKKKSNQNRSNNNNEEDDEEQIEEEGKDEIEEVGDLEYWNEEDENESLLRDHSTLSIPSTITTTTGYEYINEFKSKLKELYQLFIEPIEEYLPTDPTQTITIILHEQLAHLPFASFINPKDNSYLIEKHPINYAPSLMTLMSLYHLPHNQQIIQNNILNQQQSNNNNHQSNIDINNVLLIGNPTNNLPKADQEVLYIQSIFECQQQSNEKSGIKVFKNDDATLDNILNHIQENEIDIIHIACHGQDKESKKETSDYSTRLSLADGSYLYADDISQLKLKSIIVFLSCCFSGTGEIRNNGVMGLVWSLHASGVLSSVSSHWPLPDSNVTVEMVSIFYRSLLGLYQDDDGTFNKVNTAIALQRAMKYAIKYEKDNINTLRPYQIGPQRWSSLFCYGLL